MNQTENAAETKTVFCIALEGGVGGVDWYDDISRLAAHPHNKNDIYFYLDVPVDATDTDVTDLADTAAWEKWYENGRTDCRLSGPLQLYKGTLDWNSNDNSEGDYCTNVWATSPEDAVRQIAEEMAASAYSDEASVTYKQYVEKIISGAGPHAVELVQPTLERDLEELLQHRPADLKAIKAILNAGSAQAAEVSKN